MFKTNKIPSGVEGISCNSKNVFANMIEKIVDSEGNNIPAVIRLIRDKKNPDTWAAKQMNYKDGKVVVTNDGEYSGILLRTIYIKENQIIMKKED